MAFDKIQDVSLVGFAVSECTVVYQLSAGHRLQLPRTKTISRRDFAVSGPTTWNSLPIELPTSSLSSQTLAKKLKYHLFRC